MSNFKVFVYSILSKTNENGERETIMTLKIVDSGKEILEQHETPLQFMQSLQVLLDYYNIGRQVNKNLIEAEEFWKWLKEEGYI